mgnify:CR=1 FL=1
MSRSIANNSALTLLRVYLGRPSASGQLGGSAEPTGAAVRHCGHVDIPGVDGHLLHRVHVLLFDHVQERAWPNVAAVAGLPRDGRQPRRLPRKVRLV